MNISECKKFYWGIFTKVRNRKKYKCEDYYDANLNLDTCYVDEPPLDDKCICIVSPEEDIITRKDDYITSGIKRTNISNIIDFMIEMINKTNFEMLPFENYCHCNSLQDIIILYSYYDEEIEPSNTMVVTKFEDDIYVNKYDDPMIYLDEEKILLNKEQRQTIAEYIYSNKEKFFIELDMICDNESELIYKDKYFYIIKVPEEYTFYGETTYQLCARLKSSNKIVYLTDNVEIGEGKQLNYINNLCELIIKGGK